MHLHRVGTTAAGEASRPAVPTYLSEGFAVRTLRPLLLAAGIVLLLVGLIWIGQGTGVFPYPRSSFMIGQAPWTWRGVALACIAVVCIVVARRPPATPAPL